MMKEVSIFILCLISIGLTAQSNLSKSDIVKIDFNILSVKKSQLKSNDASLIPTYNQLLNDAETLLKYKPVSVMDKTDMPPSGNKHDYMSIGPYWWPDPTKANGTPYIRKDGEVNPEVKNYPDKDNFPKLCENIYLLSLAYYFSDDEKYAKHASKLIKVWFLDSATRMNPNLNYGQAIKGITEGRAEGIIEVRHLIFLIDAVNLIKNSESFGESKQIKLKAWLQSFSDWLQNNPIGLDEQNAKNNHGVWYDATTLAIAKYLNNESLIQTTIKRATERLDMQMDNNGNFPLELARTTSLHYTAFVLDAFTIIAQLSENTGIDFWKMETKSKKSLQKGIETVLPYFENNSSWTYPQIKPFTMSNSFQILLRSASKYDCKKCIEIIKKSSINYNLSLLNLL